MSQENNGKKISEIIAKCWSDESFKQKLLADPMAVLKAEGATVAAGMTVKAVENTDKVFTLVIPAKPTDLSDADLDKVAGGFCVTITMCAKGCAGPACMELCFS